MERNYPESYGRRPTAGDGRVAIKSVLYILIERRCLPLTHAALVLGTDPQTIARWRQDSNQAEVDNSRLLRLSHVLGIYKALAVLTPAEQPRYAWFITPNDVPLFGGYAPIEMLRESGAALEDLRAIHDYLDGQCE